MSKLNEETIAIIKALIYYVNDSHTEYSLEDCQHRGDLIENADALIVELQSTIIFKEEKGMTA